MSTEMQPEPLPNPNPMWMIVLGWVFTLPISAAMILSGVVKLMKPEDVAKMMGDEPAKGMAKLAWTADVMHVLGFIEIGCAILYLFPRTAMLGAILLTGYLGGAIAAHVRVGDPFWIPGVGVGPAANPFIVAVLMWFGVYFRDDRVRALVPWRRLPSGSPATGGFVGFLKPILLTVVAGVIAILGVAIVLAAFAAFQPADYTITRTATINAPASEVFPEINDFHKWEAWSPWTKLDPKAKNTFEGPPAGTGAIFKWEGNKDIGKGMMTILDSKPNEYVKIKLEFFEPFADVANTDFFFKEDGGKTLVTWTMSGEHDFKGKVMCLVMDMDRMVGGSFAEGLANIKAVVEASKKR